MIVQLVSVQLVLTQTLWWTISRRIRSMEFWLWQRTIWGQMHWLDITGLRRILKMEFRLKVKKIIPGLKRIIISVKTVKLVSEHLMELKLRFWITRFSVTMVKEFCSLILRLAISRRTRSIRTIRLILHTEEITQRTQLSWTIWFINLDLKVFSASKQVSVGSSTMTSMIIVTVSLCSIAATTCQTMKFMKIKEVELSVQVQASLKSSKTKSLVTTKQGLQLEITVRSN